MAYILLSVRNNRLYIDSHNIRHKKVFGVKDMTHSQIEGFRTFIGSDTRELILLSKDSDVPRLDIELIFEHSDEFMSWVEDNFIDLGQRDADNELAQIRRNRELGGTETQRLQTLKSAKTVMRVIGIIACILCFWALFYPKPYDFVIWACVIAPLLVLTTIPLSKGIVKFDGRQGGEYPVAAMAFIIPTLSLVIRAIMDWSFLSWSAFWLPFVGITITVFVLIQVANKSSKPKGVDSFAHLLFCAAYGWAVTVSLNGVLDSSESQIYPVTVLEKQNSGGKSKTWNLKLAPWALQSTPEDIEVSKSKYEAIAVGDTVDVHVREGAFGMPWYYVKIAQPNE
ncbi:MAG: hypothetical protein HRT35_13495 [Algicola sp.]|nr:hypothetical protein [Algicola sp.]